MPRAPHGHCTCLWARAPQGPLGQPGGGREGFTNDRVEGSGRGAGVGESRGGKEPSPAAWGTPHPSVLSACQTGSSRAAEREERALGATEMAPCPKGPLSGQGLSSRTTKQLSTCQRSPRHQARQLDSGRRAPQRPGPGEGGRPKRSGVGSRYARRELWGRSSR